MSEGTRVYCEDCGEWVSPTDGIYDALNRCWWCDDCYAAYEREASMSDEQALEAAAVERRVLAEREERNDG